MLKAVAGMKLRLSLPSDLETLCKIDQACFPPGVSYSRGELAGYIADPDSTTWVGVESDEIIGFLVADRQPEGMGHIITIDVVAEQRRRGAGSKLMNAAEGWARDEGLRLIYLETAEDNLNAQRFYEARGYAKIEKVERYYANGTAAWVMVKWLADKSSGSGETAGPGRPGE